eukprot:GHVU01142760.1.p1 GENE.GHVU01142760.1~~GHVU01142760.1.p1  ORF type:complete len:252 (+),score=29.52 GHVU01142760.1:2530-3285(+)
MLGRLGTGLEGGITTPETSESGGGYVLRPKRSGTPPSRQVTVTNLTQASTRQSSVQHGEGGPGRSRWDGGVEGTGTGSPMVSQQYPGGGMRPGGTRRPPPEALFEPISNRVPLSFDTPLAHQPAYYSHLPSVQRAVARMSVPSFVAVEPSAPPVSRVHHPEWPSYENYFAMGLPISGKTAPDPGEAFLERRRHPEEGPYDAAPTDAFNRPGDRYAASPEFQMKNIDDKGAILREKQAQHELKQALQRCVYD